ncbi:MAG: D-glycero-alpha-D-manno-heptose-1,7-bisphosphate 7-phosphatase [Bacteroidales bacterium]
MSEWHRRIKQGNWSLFLDRDGVLNERPGDGYVLNPAQFQWADGSLEALVGLQGIFQHIVVVTNQQGVGKGLMQASDLEEINTGMLAEIREAGAHVDGIYSATGLRASDSFRRKPGPGMALEAATDFPEICFSRSIMAGDTFSDMLFGLRLGMVTVLIGQGNVPPLYHQVVDFRFASLWDFTNFMVKGIRNS